MISTVSRMNFTARLAAATRRRVDVLTSLQLGQPCISLRRRHMQTGGLVGMPGFQCILPEAFALLFTLYVLPDRYRTGIR